MPDQYTVFLVVNSIGGGGAERVMANLVAARALAECSLSLHLVLLDDAARMRTIAPVDHEHVLDAGGSLLRSARGLRRLVRRYRPDVVVSFLIRANCATVLATAGTGSLSIICERMHTASHLKLNHRCAWRAWVAAATVRLLYPRADTVLAVSRGVAANLADDFCVPADRITTINNPIDLDRIRRDGARDPGMTLPEDYCVSIGRLVHAKGFSDVLRAYAAVRPTQALVIVGEGPERGVLERLCGELGIAQRVVFAGYRDNPFAIAARARFYVSASRNEGFPNAAAEAMALGVPTILTDCPSGPAELLNGDDGRDIAGLLVPLDDALALQTAMRRMMNNTERARLADQARARSEDFGLAPVASAYWRAILAGISDR